MVYLQAGLRWAVKMGMLAKMPDVAKPYVRELDVMKGRPITLEEFERMLDKVSAVMGDIAAPSWRHYLTGLWLSGLRLAESLELYWDRDDRLCVDLTGEYPMLRIPAELEKGGRDRLLPMAPEFAEFLLSTPEAERFGRFFKFLTKTGNPIAYSANQVGVRVGEIGRAAGIKVYTYPSGRVKCATLHGLRRSFGERWASRVMPQVLQELMRHEKIETTLRYYVGRNAQTTAKVLWQAHEQAGGNTLGNTHPVDTMKNSV